MECKGWHQEAALRMLRNNLDPEVAERPEELIVYGGSGNAARNRQCPGGMGGGRRLAATMNEGVFLGVDVDPKRVRRRVEGGYCDVMTADLDDALRRVAGAKREKQALSIGLVGNIADVLPELARRGIEID